MDATHKHLGAVVEIPRDRIRPFKGQPREFFDPHALKELARSIESVGQQVPITVRPLHGDPKHDFELVDGERRWRAAALLKLPALKAWINHDIVHEDDQFLASLVANFAREGHSPVELAKSIRRLRKHPQLRDLDPWAQYKLIGARFGRSAAWVYQYEKLLRLPAEVLELMHPRVPKNKRLRAIVAIRLADLPEPERLPLARKIVTERLRYAAAMRLIESYAARSGIIVGADRNSARKRADVFQNLLRTISDEIDAVLDGSIADFKMLLISRSAAERESIGMRIDRCIERLRELRQSLARVNTAKRAG